MEGVIFIAGIYGVGKSTLCEKLSNELRIPFYSSGDLISKVNGELYGANKVVKDKNKNQSILADAVNKILLMYPSILLAGHFCIFNKNTEVDILPEEVFLQLNIQKIVLLETTEEIIPEILTTKDAFMQFFGAIPHYAKEVLVAVGPIIALFLIFQLSFSFPP